MDQVSKLRARAAQARPIVMARLKTIRSWFLTTISQLHGIALRLKTICRRESFSAA